MAFSEWVNQSLAPSGAGLNGQLPLTNGMLFGMLPASERSQIVANGGTTLSPDQQAYAHRLYRLRTNLDNQGFADAGNNFTQYLQQQYGEGRVPESELGQIEQKIQNPQTAGQFAQEAAASLLGARQAFAQGGQAGLSMYQNAMAQRPTASASGSPLRAMTPRTQGAPAMTMDDQPFSLSQALAAQQPAQQNNPYAGSWYGSLPSWQAQQLQQNTGMPAQNPYGSAPAQYAGSPWSIYQTQPQQAPPPPPPPPPPQQQQPRMPFTGMPRDTGAPPPQMSSPQEGVGNYLGNGGDVGGLMSQLQGMAPRQPAMGAMQRPPMPRPGMMPSRPPMGPQPYRPPQQMYQPPRPYYAPPPRPPQVSPYRPPAPSFSSVAQQQPPSRPPSNYQQNPMASGGSVAPPNLYGSMGSTYQHSNSYQYTAPNSVGGANPYQYRPSSGATLPSGLGR